MTSGWMKRGACRGKNPEWWFPKSTSEHPTLEELRAYAEAKRICWDDCPVRTACLGFALEHRLDHGLWGGISERSRRRMLQERRSLQRVK